MIPNIWEDRFHFQCHASYLPGWKVL